MKLEELKLQIKKAEEANQIGNRDEAERLISIVLEYLDKPRDSIEDNESIESLRANAYIFMASLSMRRGNYKAAFEEAKKAIAIAEKYSLNELKSIAYNTLGKINFSIGNYDLALEYFYQSLTINEELGEIYGEAIANGNIGSVYYYLGKYDQALDCFTKSINANTKLGNKLEIAIGTGNIGSIYSAIGDTQKALEYNYKALDTYEELENKPGIAFNLGNIGNLYVTLCSFDKAHECLSKALSLFEEIGDKSGVARLTWNIGSLYSNPKYERYSVEEAEKYLQKAIELSKDIGAKYILYNAHKYLSELFKTEKRWEECQSHFEQYHIIEKEVVSEEAKKKVDLFEQQKQAAEREKEIEIAKATTAATMNTTTALLHKVLPKTIATRMIQSEEDIADYFTSVSILFADIEGFTPISAQMPAIIVVRFLNSLFGEFDRIMLKHGCEKIKTIGDGYMAAAGVPIECADHAERITAAAFEMIETLTIPEDIREYMPEGTKLGIRIGLHTGPVVAGVIGQDRFVYDIYSDAVNTAARMESHGVTNKIHASAEFALHLQNRFMMSKNTSHGITFENRGEIEVKGKGKMKTYFLI